MQNPPFLIKKRRIKTRNNKKNKKKLKIRKKSIDKEEKILYDTTYVEQETMSA